MHHQLTKPDTASAWYELILATQRELRHWNQEIEATRMNGRPPTHLDVKAIAEIYLLMIKNRTFP